MTQVDVAIVGAGLAGSIAAHRLAQAGVQVALLEKGTFPRDKICGDGVMAKGLAALERTGLDDWLTQFPAMTTLRISAPDARIIEIPLTASGACIGRTIPRRLLDARLAAAAVEAGARLLEGVRVENVTAQDNERLHIVADDLSLIAQMVILADGSHAPVTRRLGLLSGQPELFAVRQYLTGPTRDEGKLEVHFQSSIIPGYNWLFPVGNGHFNVGTGTYTHRLHRKEINLKQELARFRADPIIEGRLDHAEPVGPVRGFPLRTSLRDAQTHAPRVLVAGDAAGLVNPFTGEGIATALNSGELAAEHALRALQAGGFSAPALAAYSQDLRDRYQNDQWAARVLRLILSQPRLLNRAFHRMSQNENLAQVFSTIFLDQNSPLVALQPRNLLRMLIR